MSEGAKCLSSLYATCLVAIAPVARINFWKFLYVPAPATPAGPPLREQSMPYRNRGCGIAELFSRWLDGPTLATSARSGAANAPPDFGVLATKSVRTLLDAHYRMVAPLPLDCAAARTGPPPRRTSVR
jgi:hypothetical protein